LQSEDLQRQRQVPVNPVSPAAADNLPIMNSRLVDVGSSRKMEDGVKTGTKPKRRGFLMGQSSAFTREIWLILKIERTDPKS
jgi:hypothetical protein